MICLPRCSDRQGAFKAVGHPRDIISSPSHDTLNIVHFKVIELYFCNAASFKQKGYALCFYCLSIELYIETLFFFVCVSLPVAFKAFLALKIYWFFFSPFGTKNPIVFFCSLYDFATRILQLSFPVFEPSFRQFFEAVNILRTWTLLQIKL